MTIRFDTYKDAEEQMLHVLEVEQNSPAELAGLVPFKDYLLGTAEKAFTDPDVLHQELVANIDRPVEFYVYNTDTDEVRTAVIMPTEVSPSCLQFCRYCGRCKHTRWKLPNKFCCSDAVVRYAYLQSL